MAATETGVWDLQDVRDKQLASEWSYDAASDPGSLYGWGDNNYGNLGLNDRTDRSSPTQMPGTTWSNVASNIDLFVATKTDGTLWTWGRNDNGDLGQNQGPAQLADVSSPVQIPGTTWPTSNSYHLDGSMTDCKAIKTDGTLWGWGNNEIGELSQNNVANYSSPIQIPGTTWSSVSLGQNNVYAIKTNGTLWTWG